MRAVELAGARCAAPAAAAESNPLCVSSTALEWLTEFINLFDERKQSRAVASPIAALVHIIVAAAVHIQHIM